jgi:hypothetical protein
MTFQAYLDNILAQTGKTPADFRAAAQKAGILVPGVKAMALTDWLKAEHGLGHGHAMALYAVFKAEGWLGAEAAAKKTLSAKTEARAKAANKKVTTPASTARKAAAKKAPIAEEAARKKR